MLKKLLSLLLIVTFVITGCRDSNVKQVCSGISRISKCCKELKSATVLTGTKEGTENEDALVEVDQPSAPLPNYSWDTRRVVW